MEAVGCVCAGLEVADVEGFHEKADAFGEGEVGEKAYEGCEGDGGDVEEI